MWVYALVLLVIIGTAVAKCSTDTSDDAKRAIENIKEQNQSGEITKPIEK